MRSGVANSQRSSAAGLHSGRDLKLVALLCLLICLPLFAYRAILLLKPLPLQDFLIYWSAGHVFLTGGDPYSSSALLTVEQSLGWLHPVPEVMLNPPWTLPFVVPLALAPFPVAHYGWLAISAGLEVVCSLACWRYFGGERRKRWIALALVASFLPAASAEHYGQITPLILAGITGLLFALRGNRKVLAGVCVLVLGLKPHLLYLVLLAILLWSIRTRRWAIPATASLLAIGLSLAAVVYNRNVLGYFRGTVPGALAAPCGVGGLLRSVLGVQHVWLQFVPCVAGMTWFAFYWLRYRREWAWQERLPLLLLVSIGSAAYFWKHDFVLAIPALIAVAARITRPQIWLAATACYALVQFAILSANTTVDECVASLLWIVLYGLVTVWCVPPSRREELAPVP